MKEKSCIFDPALEMISVSRRIFLVFMIVVVPGTELLSVGPIFRSAQDNFDLTESKGSPGESMGGSEGLKPPACLSSAV